MTRVSRLHPEWWALAICAGAWLLLVSGVAELEHDHAAMAAGLPQWRGALLHWLLMVMAMMLPLVAGPVRGAAIRSLWRRRHQAIAAFLVGYVAFWMAAGAVFIFAVARLRLEHSAVALPAALVLAAVWHLMPARRRALHACHRSAPLAPSGWRAHWDSLRYGWVVGGRCLVTCGVLMLACLLAGHNLWLMAAFTLAGVGERYLPRLPDATPAAVMLALAVFFAWPLPN